MKLRYVAVLLGVVSVSAHANILNYGLSNSGSIINCKARPSGVGLCRKVNPNLLAGSTGAYNTNNGMFQVTIPGQASILMHFAGNVANQSFCAEIHDPLIVEPLSYCQIGGNYHVLINMRANFNPANQNIVINSDVTEDIGGLMTVTYTLSGTTLSKK